jgi:hypothetical protein
MTVEQRAIEAQADEILNRHLEYMDGQNRGQVLMRVRAARAAVIEALRIPVQGGGVPVAWRWRYLHPGKVNHWTLRASRIESQPARPGLVAIEAEPLYLQATPSPSSEREALELAAKVARERFAEPAKRRVHPLRDATVNRCCHPRPPPAFAWIHDSGRDGCRNSRRG